MAGSDDVNRALVAGCEPVAGLFDLLVHVAEDFGLVALHLSRQLLLQLYLEGCHLAKLTGLAHAPKQKYWRLLLAYGCHAKKQREYYNH